MKAQKLILWLGAILIVFLSGYLRSVTSPNFPLSGTTGMDAKKITYLFEKRAHVTDTLHVKLRTDLTNLRGDVIVFTGNTETIIPLRSSYQGTVLSAGIPVKKMPATVNYSVRLQYKDSIFTVPAGVGQIATVCVPKVPISIMSVYYFFLYLGMLLAIRIGLEYFSNGLHVKRFSLFALISFSLYGFFIIPVINFIEANAINKTVLQPESMFTIPSLALCVVWIVGVIVLFSRISKPWMRLVFAALTLIIYFFNPVV